MLMRTKINKKILYVVYILELVVIAFLALQLFRPLQSYHFQANDFERNGNQGIVMDSFPYSDQSGLYVDNSMMEESEHEGPWYYEQISLGYNYRLTDFQAASLSARSAEKTFLGFASEKLYH